jgi:predicted XRE-type DNA-binding protein
MTEEIKVHSSSGNVFADLGLSNPEELLIKAELAHQISELISERQLSDDRAANLLEIDRPTLSALMRGKLLDFTTERLFLFLNALGSNVEIRIAHSPPNVQAKTRIVVAS